jgi:RNA polymerase sigma factor (TIGR02999 family)
MRLAAAHHSEVTSTTDQTEGEDVGPSLPGLLAAAAAGNREAFDRAYALLYDELSALARAQRGRWRGNETLSTTVLVHEAYLKLAGATGRDTDDPRWQDRRHFFALAAQVMRQVLVNYAEGQRAAKRGGDRTKVPFEALELMPPMPVTGVDASDTVEADRILALHEALGRLAALDMRQARIVECRFFAGLSIPETAEALGISPATVKRDWQAASAWLSDQMGDTGR